MGTQLDDDNIIVGIAKVVLMLVNMVFMVAGCLLIYFSQRVKEAGWVDAFNGSYAWVGNSTFIFTLILGIVVITLSAIGCVGAWLRHRLMLMIYAVILIVTAGLFIVIAIAGNSVKSKAQTWSTKSFPASSDETSVGSNFNRLYCYAQITYYCTVPVTEIIALFQINVGAAASILSSVTVPQACAASTSRPDQLNQLCKLCELVNRYKNYAPVADWAQTSCPRSDKNQQWCGTFLLKGTGEVYANNSPYSECRTAFLDLVNKWGGFFLIMSIIVIIATIAVFGFALLTRHGTKRLDEEEEVDDFVVDTPSPIRYR